MTRLEPGAASALRHWHTRQDEFVYVLDGELTLVTDAGETVLRPGMCAGFPAGKPDGHQLVNRSDEPATYLEVGDRSAGDEAHYPDEDLRYDSVTDLFTHRDGTPW
nr:cupin domain-containing protein [Azospirillum baldaniorum]